MAKRPRRKLIRIVMDAVIAAGLILILRGEEKAQVLKNKAKSIFT